jgi:hypothetical protein
MREIAKRPEFVKMAALRVCAKTAIRSGPGRKNPVFLISL